MEVEEENQLPFLYVLGKKRKDATRGHIVYRKSTYANRYVNAQSHYHLAQLKAAVKKPSYQITSTSVRRSYN